MVGFQVVPQWATGDCCLDPDVSLDPLLVFFFLFFLGENIPENGTVG